MERQIIYNVDDGIQSEQTKRRYRVSFKGFLEYSQTTQESLLEENPRQLEDRIIGYLRFVHSVKKRSSNTINTDLYAILHFFEINDVMLNRRKITRFLPPDEAAHNDDRAYTHQEIQELLLQCDERSRVMILLMASTGMRIGAVPELKIGHLTEIPDYNIYKIMVYASSKNDRYYTFCTPECATAINSYLGYRTRFGEELKDKSPLIREQFDITNRFAAQYPKVMTYWAIIWLMTDILQRTGFKTKGEVMRSHGLRKFAITQMIKAKVDYNTREYIVGHKHSRGLDFNYDRTAEEDRLEEYLKAVDLLTINPENRLKHKIKKMELEHSLEWNQLKAQMDELRQVLSNKSIYNNQS